MAVLVVFMISICHTSDHKVAGLIPDGSTARQQPWASCSHTCASVHQTVQFGTSLIAGNVTAVYGRGLVYDPYS